MDYRNVHRGVTLALDQRTHTYYVNDLVVPGVTGTLDMLSQYEGIPSPVLEYKSAIGRAVHKACELDDLGDLDEESVGPNCLPYLQAWRQFRADMKLEIIAVEQWVYHPKKRYAGQLDVVGRMAGAVWIIDRKCTATLSRVCGLQTAAYMAAWNEGGQPANHLATKRAAVQLRPDGRYMFQEYSDTRDFTVYCAALLLSSWRLHNKV